jgi:hypothetical protein
MYLYRVFRPIRRRFVWYENFVDVWINQYAQTRQDNLFIVFQSNGRRVLGEYPIRISASAHGVGILAFARDVLPNPYQFSTTLTAACNERNANTVSVLIPV